MGQFPRQGTLSEAVAILLRDNYTGVLRGAPLTAFLVTKPGRNSIVKEATQRTVPLF